jgi:hypothetical protein
MIAYVDNRVSAALAVRRKAIVQVYVCTHTYVSPLCE